MVTANNLCRLKREGCMSNDGYEVLHPGECNSGEPNTPLECTALPRYEKVTDANQCTTRDDVAIGACRGGCGNEAGKCCTPEEYEYNFELFVCPDGTSKYMEVLIIKSCYCLEGEKVEEMPLVKSITFNPGEK